MSLTILIYEAYKSLQSANPNHELLQYFTETDGNFQITENKEHGIEFVEKFGKRMNGVHEAKSFEEYSATVIATNYCNYLKALKNAINEQNSQK